jgi:pilus assembly protein CpaB
VTPAARRRRGLLLLSLALVCGGLAASQVSGRVHAVDRRVGRPVPVLVAARPVEQGTPLRADDLAVRRVPSRYAPADALTGAGSAVGATPSAPLARGAYVTAGALEGTGGDRRGGLGPGQRAVEVQVAGGAALAEAAPGSRVDVVVATEPRSGSGRAFLALEDVELLGLENGRGAGAGDGAGSGGQEEGAGARATATATLRVTLRQAVYLSAAENFAREVRLLPRPAGDRGRAGRADVTAEGL